MGKGLNLDFMQQYLVYSMIKERKLWAKAYGVKV